MCSFSIRSLVPTNARLRPSTPTVCLTFICRPFSCCKAPSFYSSNTWHQLKVICYTVKMKYVWIAGALATAAGTVAAQNSGCSQENGNWYCSQVDAISYSNFGTAGQFQEVTLMGATGQCEFAPESYQGGMAPFDGEVGGISRGNGWECMRD